MRLTCMFSFILLFGAAGLLVFIHLQDPAELVHQQMPGLRFNIGLQSPKKDCTSSNQDGKIMGNTADKLLIRNQAESPHPPYQLPTKFQSSNRRQRNVVFLMKDNEKKGIEMNPIRPHKRRKRILIKKSPILIAMNSSTVTLSRLVDHSNNSWKRLYQIQRGRKKLMQDVCSKYKSNSRRVITPYHVSRIFVEDKHQILYCEVPKAGCSNWKRVLMVLNGLASSTNDIQHNTVHYGNYLRRLDGFDRKGISQRLNTYTKMLFIREPFERLVSAFRDKFEHANNYYHPVFGKAIISKYRRNATREALRTGSGVQFKEFIQYLLDVHKPVGMDIHWDHVSRLCSPCLIDYDFIGKFESMEEDADFLLHLISAPHNLTFPRFKDRHSNEERTTNKITQQYFAQLSSSERQRTYDFYYMDYLMFNYSKPFEDLY
ncbi:carbohydrate sulfotransferase 8 [Rhinatrema bivittatum]|uniref:carbohydrate sulfotransferase 8 n=1 Tax=Rhinatrema bivittatum TaxID=194408 RepID=UPI00112735F2|nr:carbohydrate sulfotransferase 8 [Rhinatrema bivittatum]XP_029464213.1 carbohydrate sulfotransferase 8 [Rhinatrema bivittatum]